MLLTSIARPLTFLAVITGSLTLNAGVTHGATLSGYVKEAVDEAGLPGVTVIARNDGKTEVARFDSVDRGFYSLKDLPTGKELHVSYQRLGYGTVQEICKLAADQSLDVLMASDHASAAYYDRVAFKISSRFGRPLSAEAIRKEVQRLGLPPAKGELVQARIAALQGSQQLSLRSSSDRLASRQTGRANEWDTTGHDQREREQHDQTATGRSIERASRTARVTVASVDADKQRFAVHSKGGTDQTFKTTHDTAVQVAGAAGHLADLKKGDCVTVVYKSDGTTNVATEVRVSKPAAAKAAKPPSSGTG